jgi:predicted ATP-dependent protease
VVLPSANIGDLVLAEEVTRALAQGCFRIWAIDRVEEAVAIFTAPPGSDLSDCQSRDLANRAAAVYARMDANLAKFAEAQRLYDGRGAES